MTWWNRSCPWRSQPHTAMDAIRTTFCTGMLVALTASIAAAQGIETESLRRKQEDQQRARAMTRELVGSVLDLQLRQLVDNGLEDLPVYHDIQLMREHLVTLVDAEMVKVVDLLASAQRKSVADREATFVEARKQIRTVVIRLSAERQTLLRRLRLTELAEQTRRLIGVQTTVRNVTKSLPEESTARQESLLLKTQEDQRDVRELFLQLVQTLDDVRQWGGAIAATASKGLQLLKSGDIGKHVDQSEVELVANRPPSAVEHQDSVLKGLRELLKLLEKAHGAMSPENRELLDQIRALSEQQSTLRQETRQGEPDQPAPPALVEKQAELQQKIAELERSLPDSPTAVRLTEQAEIAAKDATTELFDGRQDFAVAKQSEVLGNLAALEQLLGQGTDAPPSDHTAAELATKVQELRQVRDRLQVAAENEAAAEKQAGVDAQTAVPLEHAAADAIAAAEKITALPAELARRIVDAEQAARSAEAALAATVGQATEEVSSALQRADDALDRARAAVSAALHDAERQAAAVKIGELARAAEALERAAAEERAIAKVAEQAARDAAVAPQEAVDLQNRQADVEAIANKLTEALREITPKTSEIVARAAQAADESKSQLRRAAAMPSPTDAAAATKSAIEPAHQAAQALTQAAKQLRAEVGQVAMALADDSRQQATAFAEVRDAVEDQLNGPAATLAEKMAPLQAAEQKTAEAARWHQRAIGRPEAAAAMDLVEHVAQLQQAQRAAQEASAAVQAGQSATPLKASAQQQAVAEMAAVAALKAAQRPQAVDGRDPLTETLQQAQEAAGQAAKQVFDGQHAAAATLQKQVDQALAQARQLATKEAVQARQTVAATDPDIDAERSSRDSARIAEKMAGSQAPEAGSSLKDAAAAADQAIAALAANDAGAVRPPQQQVEQHLDRASQQLRQVLDQLGRQAARELAREAAAIDPLASRAAMLDPTATEALEAAQRAAEAGALSAAEPAGAITAAQSAERQLERAAATLSAKEQQIRRDQAVAQALASLAAQQQTAADLLAEQRGRAEAALPDAAAGEKSAMSFDAAEAAHAADEFAEAQRATGQGAAEISGQQQVANPPLRQALSMAAQLPTTQQAARRADAASSKPIGEPLSADANPASTADTDAAGDKTVEENAGPSSGPAQGQPTTPQSAAPSDAGFVPQSPELTAQLVAGPEAMAKLRAAHAGERGDPARSAEMPKSMPSTPSSPSDDANELPADEPANGTTFSAGKPKPTGKNPAVKDGPLEKQPEDKELRESRPGQSGDDANNPARQFQEQSWFAKLPPELRRSIRAGSQQKAPRAYEDRLKRYFQSVD